jgi:NRPS condensation-like uncharacterized protein
MTSDRNTDQRSGRPLTMYERALYLGAGFHVNVMTTARISGQITEEQITRALRKIQDKHAVLRCLVEHKGDRPWFVPQDHPAPIPLRILDRQTDQDWFDVSTQESLQPFDGSSGPLARVVWLRGPMESELLLVCSHALCDGRSLMTLLRELLLLCDQPDAGIGAPTSLNSLEEVFPAEVLADRKLRRRIRWKVRVTKLMLRCARLGKPWIYGSIYRSLWTVDEQTSQLLVARCKAEGATVFSALALACMLAFRRICGPRQIEKFEAPVDFRRYLPDLRSDSLFAIAPTIVLSLQKLQGIDPDTSDFWAMARALKSDMSGKMDRLKSTAFPLFLGIEHLHDFYARMAVYARSKRAGRKVSLSYVGKIDAGQNYRGFRLAEICDISAMMTPTPAHLIAMYSFGGRFHFSFSSDESSLPEATALQIREQIVAILHASLTSPDTFPITVAATSAVGAEVS